MEPIGELPKPIEQQPKTPTGASNSFLLDWGRKVKSTIDTATKLPWAALTMSVSTGGIFSLGGFDPRPDIAEGEWGRLAVKGILAGIMVTPAVRSFLNLNKDE